jgi:hypothetical protein
MGLSICQCFSQKKDSTWVGAIRGIVWDSEHNAVLRAATIAIYLDKDSLLVGYRLTNNYGEFEYKGLPCNVPIKIIATYIGYKRSIKRLSISSVKTQVDVGHLDLQFISNDLKEVVVNYTPPPVQMNRDTLEFNADAFKLAPNAQTEDLLRILPGITIWGDGTITVNGREVKSVLVNGKPFFGGDTRIATQNIPKDVVNMVQVYKKDKNPKNPTDSTTEVNIKLKKGKEIGYFGKLSVGYGTQGHYDGDGSLNFFGKRTQLGLALSSNNVNKVANDINFILRNSTFKGNGASVEFQSNFDIQGLNQFTAGGLIFQHDFIDKPNYYNNNRLTVLHFLKNNKQDLVQNTETITTLNENLFFKQQNVSKNNNAQESQNSTIIYDRVSNGNKFSAEGNFMKEVTDGSLQNESYTYNQNNDRLSRYAVYNRIANSLNNFNFKSNYTHDSNSRSWLSGFEVGYKLYVTDKRDYNNYQSVYEPEANQEKKIDFDRIYHNRSTTLMNNLKFILPNFGTAIFGDYNPAGITTGLKNDIELTTGKVRSNVSDRDVASNQYSDNAYLTNNRSETDLNIKPVLTFNKRISRSLSNRFDKNFLATVNMGVQLYNLNSASDKTFQQFTRSWQKFIPTAGVSYSNRQFGEFTNSLSLNVNASSQYPTIQQLAPLVDSINLNFIQVGNASLKSEDTRELSLKFAHSSENSANILTWSATVSTGYIINYFTSSSVIDSLGRTVFTTVNADGYRYLNGLAELKKAFKWANNQLQFSISPVVSINRTPNYINGFFSYYNNLFLSCNPGVNYTYKDWLIVNIMQQQSYNRYSQDIANAIKLSSLINQSSVSLSVNCTPHLIISSNATYTKNTYNGSDVQNFTIWNAAINYKFLKKNSAEIKFSALDILNQNTGLINYGLNNSITQGSKNILQQYFMLGLAYYPRKFGK